MATTDRHNGDWATLIGAAENRPDGWKTMSEIVKETGCPTSTARGRVQRLIAEGKAETKEFAVTVGGRRMVVACYRIVE